MKKNKDAAAEEPMASVEREKDFKVLYEEMTVSRDLLAAEAEKKDEEIKNLSAEAARARADYYNLRTRVERDRERDCKLAAEQSIGELMPVLENLERVCDMLEDKESNFYKGITMVIKQFVSSMERLGLEMIPTEGLFDPAVHEAVSMEPIEDETKDGHIIGALSKGYKLAGRVIKAPRVRVGRYSKD